MYGLSPVATSSKVLEYQEKLGFFQPSTASQLLFDIFGEAGRHARTAVALNQLPLDATVEIEFIVEIKE